VVRRSPLGLPGEHPADVGAKGDAVIREPGGLRLVAVGAGAGMIPLTKRPNKPLTSLPLHRAFDAGLQPGLFPDQAASLLTCRCRKRMLPGRMRRGGRGVSARAWRLVAGLHAGGVRCFSACGLEADLPHCHPCRVGAGFVPAGGVVEGRRDLDVAPSARCRLARAASRSLEIDVAGPGGAGPARRDAASRPGWPRCG
jgi:hypothetical protein